MRRTFICIAFFLYAFLGNLAKASDQSPLQTIAVLSGVVTVRDGDGLLFGDIEVRLQGVAAPEFWSQRQPMGEESRQHLVDLAWGKFVVCHLDGTTAGKGKRPVGICYLDNLDLGLLQVQQGYARDCARYSKGRYAAAEQTAQNAGNNLSEVYALPNYCAIQ